MEELRPEELEELVQELEGQPIAGESSVPEVEKLLRDLRAGSLDTRLEAAHQLGASGTRGARIVRALLAASESDPHVEVRRAAARSLQAPVHQQYLQRQVSLDMHVKIAAALSVLPAGNPRYWLLASAYAPFLVAATSLLFVVEGNWRFWVAGAVWLVGGGIGLYVLNKKGHRALVDKHSSWLEGPDGSGLFLLAVVGLFLLLAALLMRAQEPTYGIAIEPEEKRLDLAESTEKARQQRPSSDPPRAQRPRRRKEAATPSRRRKPVSNLHIGLMLSAGVVLLGIGIAGVQADMPAGMPRTWQNEEFMLYVELLSLLCLLPAVVLSGWALWNWLAPWGARNVFRRSMKETSAEVRRAWRDEQTNEYGRRTGYKYFVWISFQADDVHGDSRDILLRLRVKRPIWESLEADMTVTARYATENPRIALIRGEW